MGQPRTKFTSKDSGVALDSPFQSGGLCVTDQGGPPKCVGLSEGRREPTALLSGWPNDIAMADYTQTYTVVIEPAQDGWRAYCLEVPECVGQGAGRQAAYRAVKESIRVYLRRCLSSGNPVPRRRRIIKYPRFDLRNLGFDVDNLR
jgi:predicted RNase H-like HicB family nuclease